MNALRPFFLLLGRLSVFWLSVFGLVVMSILVTGLSEPDEKFGMYIDSIFISAFGFPLLAGWLAGAVIQELQHTSFAAVLPKAGPRMFRGFLFAGVAMSLIVTVWIALVSDPVHSLPVLFAIGLSAYCLGGILLDPLSSWLTSLNVVVVVALLMKSGSMGHITAGHPWITIGVTLGVGALCLFRLFARSTFRLKPFRATAPIPGSFSLEKTREFERQRMIREISKRSNWHSRGYLGGNVWRWVRAAFHETHGARSWKTVVRVISRGWGLGLLIVAHAWADKGEWSLGEAIARSLYDGLFRSPYQAVFGERGGQYPLVMIVISLLGIVIALFNPIALNGGIVHPLSRKQVARVSFRCGLVDGAILLLTVGLGWYLVGQLMGILVGIEMRYDYVPFYFRVLLVTLFLLPLAHWGRLKVQEAERKKFENTLIGVIFGIVGFVLTTGIGTWLSPRLFGPPLTELLALSLLILASQLFYRHKLNRYYQTADLA
jgi:hypothetical protein